MYSTLIPYLLQCNIHAYYIEYVANHIRAYLLMHILSYREQVFKAKCLVNENRFKPVLFTLRIFLNTEHKHSHRH